MKRSRSAIPALPLFATLVIAGSTGVAYTATNVVAPSKLADRVVAKTVSQFVPSECSFLTLTVIVSGSGSVVGGSASELMLGDDGVDTFRGNGGNDCILGGDGNDTLQGDGGTDVCLGMGGTDTFHSSCEFRIQ